MGWKTINGRRYYYKSVREGTRIETQYVGPGEIGELMENLIQVERLEGAKIRSEEKERREEAQAEESELIDWFGRVEDLANYALEEAGFHKHKGQWRRKRDGRNEDNQCG